MQKWRNILDILLISLLLSSCITSPDAPKLPRQPKQYAYMDEPDKWGRLDENEKLELAGPEMRNYLLYPIEDIEMILLYMVEVNERCEKWRPVDGN